MKCLLKYQWVKLPRAHLPAGKGVMGYWAKLASKIPAGCYFVLGDNIDDSTDSQHWDDPFVYLESVVARELRK